MKLQTHFINDEDGNPITDPTASAEAFNSFFANIFQMAPHISNLNDKFTSSIKEHVSKHCSTDQPFNIPPISENYVSHVLCSLDVSKATGLDGISARFLKIGSPAISKPLAKIINLSIQQGKYPNQFKIAKVTPIFKKGSKYDRNNYRPISILPVLSKIIEKHVSDSLKKFLEDNKLLHTHQSGFRSNHSCETALTALVDEWIHAVNNNKLVGTIFLDLTKAFDLVNHSILIDKLKCYNVSVSAVKWFESYLTDRSQKVCVSGKFSNSLKISSGVPQGSVLGPILFILYINDVPFHLQQSSTDMFADDTTITVKGESLLDIKSQMQSELHVVEDWCKHNAMILNAQKTKAMCISASNKVQNQIKSAAVQLSLNNTKIEYTENEKLLGIQVDCTLRWRNQIEQTLKKCNSQLYLLLRIKQFLNIHMRKLFFNAYILPHLDYCCTIWGNCSSELQNSMIKFQKRAARIILDKDYDTPSQVLFQELRWLTFPERVDFKKAILIYKSLHDVSAPVYMREKFSFSSVTNRTLRSSNNGELKVPKPNLEFFRKSLSYSGAKLWNQIPISVRNAETLHQFKNAYVQWKLSSSL